MLPLPVQIRILCCITVLQVLVLHSPRPLEQSDKLNAHCFVIPDCICESRPKWPSGTSRGQAETSRGSFVSVKRVPLLCACVQLLRARAHDPLMEEREETFNFQQCISLA